MKNLFLDLSLNLVLWDWINVSLLVQLPLRGRSSYKKNEGKTSFFSLNRAFKEAVQGVTTVTLGNSFELPVLFKRLGWRLLSACTSRKVKFTSRLKNLVNFVQHIMSLNRRHGGMFVVKYLKACQLAVQRCIAGHPATSLVELAGEGPFPRLDRRGLPRIIPIQDRRLMKTKSFTVIRW
jgi:hypothetical protein